MSVSQRAEQLIALDVGGTSMKGAVLAADGRGGEFRRWPTPRAAGPDAVVAAILQAVDDLVQSADNPVAIGLVVPGVVDDYAGVAVYSENIEWHDVPFRALVAERTGLPVGFGHDVRAGGLAEREFGVAAGVDDVLFLPIGTGISGAMFVEGRLIENMYAGEIGHIDVGSGRACACGAQGCLEATASGASIARMYTEATGEQVSGSLGVLQRMQQGDDAARQVWGQAVGALARALATYVSLLAPELIVVAGGLSEAGDVLLDPLRARLSELLVWQREPRLVVTSVGDTAGCLGAGILARQALTDSIPPQQHTTE
jgi:glucokinase